MQSQQTNPQTTFRPNVSGPLAPIDATLNSIFVTSLEESRLQKARSIVKLSAATISDEELEIALTEFQHLIDYWLDQFELHIFDGNTLGQMLGQH
ncbi:MAG: hypothetical protein ABI602_01175 [Candidatus Saccharibacteria bacterium]